MKWVLRFLRWSKKGFEFDEDLIDQYEATEIFRLKTVLLVWVFTCVLVPKALGNWSQKVLKEKIELFKGTDMEGIFYANPLAFSLHRKSMF